jgi:hypothetical protein
MRRNSRFWTVSQRVSFGTKSEGPKTKASSVSKLSPQRHAKRAPLDPRIAFAASSTTLFRKLGLISAPNALRIQLDEKSLGLIGNVSAQKCPGRSEPFWAEAVSISRLEGSRWRLRQMRSAMGFECQFGTHSTWNDHCLGGDLWGFVSLAVDPTPDCSDAQERSEFAHRPTDGHAQRLPRQRLRARRQPVEMTLRNV